MPYLIDGHNLIPKLGLRLEDVDDELALVERLQAWCRVTRRQVEVYFDGAPAGQAGTRRFGQVVAHFVRLGRTADSAIQARLVALGRGARNWTVVTSDRSLQAMARTCGAAALSSEEFARQMQTDLRPVSRSTSDEGEPPTLSSDELEEWLRLFREKKR